MNLRLIGSLLPFEVRPRLLEQPMRRTQKESVSDWHLTDDLHAEGGQGDPFAAAIRATRMSMIFTDPRQPDNPIVFVNESFLRLTGYTRDEVLGLNCRFLQGPDTSQTAIDEIRAAIESRNDLNIDILNYRKDGSSFWNALYISPVSNDSGEIQFYFASQLDVTERKQTEKKIIEEKSRFEAAVKRRTLELEEALEAKNILMHEVDHRVKNNLQMVSSLILMQSRSIRDEAARASLKSMLERVEALSTVHRRLYQSKNVSQFDVSEFVRDLVANLLAGSGQPGIQPDLELEPIVISAEKATPVALMVNELVTNSLKHAFPPDAENADAARIGIRMYQLDGHFNLEVFDNGIGIDSPQTDTSFGARLVKSLSRQLHAQVEWQNARPGTRVIIRMPHEPIPEGRAA